MREQLARLRDQLVDDGRGGEDLVDDPRDLARDDGSRIEIVGLAGRGVSRSFDFGILQELDFPPEPTLGVLVA